LRTESIGVETFVWTGFAGIQTVIKVMRCLDVLGDTGTIT
jgi:hypothetical protein